MARPVPRPVVHASDIERAFACVRGHMEDKLRDKGPGGFKSSHEIRGTLGEEWDELRDAIREDKWPDIAHELQDIAVAAIFGLASMCADTLDWPEAPDNRMDRFPEPVKDGG